MARSLRIVKTTKQLVASSTEKAKMKKRRRVHSRGRYRRIRKAAREEGGVDTEVPESHMYRAMMECIRDCQNEYDPNHHVAISKTALSQMRLDLQTFSDDLMEGSRRYTNAFFERLSNQAVKEAKEDIAAAKKSTTLSDTEKRNKILAARKRWEAAHKKLTRFSLSEPSILEEVAEDISRRDLLTLPARFVTSTNPSIVFKKKVSHKREAAFGKTAEDD